MSAGLTGGWLYDPDSGERYGGLVCEYSGSLPADDVPDHLREMLGELHMNGYEHLRLDDISTRVASVSPVKMYGTALVALCFTSYYWPVLGRSSDLP